MTAEERAARGARMRELMQGGEIEESLSNIEAQLSDEWKRTFDPAQRENLWRTVRVLELLRADIGQIMGDGKMAQHQLSALKRA